MDAWRKLAPPSLQPQPPTRYPTNLMLAESLSGAPPQLITCTGHNLSLAKVTTYPQLITCTGHNLPVTKVTTYSQLITCTGHNSSPVGAQEIIGRALSKLPVLQCLLQQHHQLCDDSDSTMDGIVPHLVTHTPLTAHSPAALPQPPIGWLYT
eukprot:scaffold75770_cov21-Tisochrysis_lutea.AAC.1